MFTKDIGIDLGTANVLIYVKGKGIVLNEPSVVAINTNDKSVLAVGEEARQMLGRTPGNIIAIRPLKDGVIADFEVTEAMLKRFIQKIGVKSMFGKPRILICTPAQITPVEQKAIKEAAQKSGAKEVFLEEEPKAAAVGAGMDIFQPSGNLVVDMGGGTTDVAMISMGEIVTATSLKIAGNHLDHTIIRHVKKAYNLLIGERSAEEIKINIATVFPGAKNEEMDIKGRDMISGLPKTINIKSDEIRIVLEESALAIVQAVKSVLERTPPELSADIIEKGIYLTGGGALLHGLDRLLAEHLLVPVFIADEPLTCVARGTGIMLDHLDKAPKQKI